MPPSRLESILKVRNRVLLNWRSVSRVDVTMRGFAISLVAMASCVFPRSLVIFFSRTYNDPGSE